MSEQDGLIEGNDIKFLSVRGRLFIEKSNTEVEGWDSYDWEVDGNSGTTWFKPYKGIIGKIIKTFEVTHDTYDTEQKYLLQTKGGNQIQVGIKKHMNSYNENLMKRMCNDEYKVDEVIKLVPYSKPKGEGKKGTNDGIMLFTEDEDGEFNHLVEKAYTVKNPGDCPSWNKETPTKGKNKGKVIWDNDDCIDFLTENLNTKFGVEVEDDMPI